jgi:hypothetical protein
VIPLDFFVSDDTDPWLPAGMGALKALVDQLRAGALDGRTDLEAAIALAALAHDELLAFGTGGGQQLTDPQIASVLVALRAVTKRLAVTFDPQFRNFTTFKTYWLRNDGFNSWHARRTMLEELFEPLHMTLVRLEENTLDALANPITPHAELGWPVVDEEIRELRRRFQTASTPQDYRALGTNCVGVLIALSGTVYDASKHLRPEETEPPLDKTKQRLTRYVEASLGGQENEDVRGLAIKAIELAHHVKHSPASTRREAGIAADAVILLANIFKRLDQPE